MFCSVAHVIKKLGFDLEDFGDGSILLRSIPTLFGKVIDKQMLLDIADDIKSEKKIDSLTILKDKIITRMSCKASEKAGDDLTIVQAQKILSNLFRLKGNSYNCPHGRPTLIEFQQKDLEKMFKRIR